MRRRISSISCNIVVGHNSGAVRHFKCGCPRSSSLMPGRRHVSDYLLASLGFSNVGRSILFCLNDFNTSNAGRFSTYI